MIIRITCFVCLVLLSGPLLGGLAEMLHLQAQRNDTGVEIKWGIVDPEEIPERFVLERSMDGRSFQAIHEETAQEQEKYLEYQFQDNSISESALPKVYYRLQTVPKEGEIRYSHVVEVDISNEPYIRLDLFPNPAEIHLFAQYRLKNLKGKKLHIMSSLGKSVWTKPVAILEGMHTEVIDVRSWNPGIYYLQLQHEAGEEIYKFIIQK
ncbi:MAG: T9SS type A sorting domain-containing protein [Bacteroidota bacterium]